MEMFSPPPKLHLPKRNDQECSNNQANSAQVCIMEGSRGYPAVWEACADLKMATHHAIYVKSELRNPGNMPRMDESYRPPVSGTIWSKHGLWAIQMLTTRVLNHLPGVSDIAGQHSQ